jgi:hypothetical protein
MVKMAAKSSLVILFALVIYTAPTVIWPRKLIQFVAIQHFISFTPFQKSLQIVSEMKPCIFWNYSVSRQKYELIGVRHLRNLF